MTIHTTTTPAHEVFVRRRFFFLFLPLIVLGAIVYIVASMATLTINGLGLLGVSIIGLSIIAAAWDAGDRQ